MGVPVVRFPIIPMVRAMGVMVATLVMVWTVHYRGGLALVSDNKDLIFNVHPVLMVIGLVILNGEAMLAYKTVSGTKSFKKLVHLTLQFIAFCISIVGVWAALKFHNDKGIENFYSLHSWLGLACLFLFGIQVLLTVLTFIIKVLQQQIAFKDRRQRKCCLGEYFLGVALLSQKLSHGNFTAVFG